MDIAVLCRPLGSEGPKGIDSIDDAWNQRTYCAGRIVIHAMWSRRDIVGVSCGWTEWRDGWALWSAENTTLFELRRNLAMSAIIPDDEVMRAALDRWGLAAREQTYSMWAGAVWRESTGELCFFRDRVGLTPAFYCRDESTQSQAFSTSMTLIQEHFPNSRVVNQRRLHSFLLCQNDTGRDDFFEAVSRLLPGESWSLIIRGSDTLSKPPEIQRYWHPGMEKSDISNQEDAAQFLLEKLQNISADYLRAGYDPINCVSGGMDSTLMLAIQVEQARKLGIDSECIAAVTIGYPSFPMVDETVWTSQLHAYLNHPIASVNMEGCWPMQDPDFYLEHPELGPDFHPGSNYESAFVGRIIEKYGSRPIFWGIGADQLLKTSTANVITSLLNEQGTARLVGLNKAIQVFGSRQIAKYLVGTTFLGDPLRTIRQQFKQIVGSHDLPWQVPENWVKLSVNGMSAESTANQAQPQATLFTLGWGWELVIRSLRRKANRWGSFNHMPYLRADFVNAVLTLNSELLFKREHRKGLQQEMSINYLPDSIRRRSKGGLFSKVVEFGLSSCDYSQIERLFDAHSSPIVSDLVDRDKFLEAFASYRSFCWSNQGTEKFAGEMLMWQSIAGLLWAQRVC